LSARAAADNLRINFKCETNAAVVRLQFLRADLGGRHNATPFSIRRSSSSRMWTPSSSKVTKFYLLDDLFTSVSPLSLLSSIQNSQPIHEFQSPKEVGKIVSFLTSSPSPSLNCLIACYSKKLTCCWNIQTRELIGSCDTAKKPTAVSIATLPTDQSNIARGEEEVLLVSDKGGEVWAMPIPSLSKRVRLFGHTGSVITDTLVTKTSSSSSNPPPHLSILTADRDEKIRITEFPATYVVQSYLLGHTDVITTLALCCRNHLSSDDGYILSAGWDHKLCVWSQKDLNLIDMTQVNHLETTSSTATTSDIPAAEMTESTAFEGDIQGEEVNEVNEENEGNDQDENRPFDAAKAGTFPMKIISSSNSFPAHNSSHTLTPIAIICWQLSEIKLYALEDTETPSNGRLYRSSGETVGQPPSSSQQATHTVIPLPAPPVDCLWMQSDSSQSHEQKLIVLLPSPHCLQIYSISCPSLPMETPELFHFQQLDLESFAGLRDLNDYIRVNGIVLIVIPILFLTLP
jgi:hypothetical protein